ncbi:MAG: helix-turn-helix domain-containing protein [Chrysiogenia bacterium]
MVANENAVNEFLTAREAAALLRVTLATVYNLTYRRRIPFFKPGGKTVLFRRADLLAFIENGRVPVKGG